ncbi:MAG TPA: DUF1203 domain-containing protein [Chloroflexia bacterium]|nr:DUF1203 domain-containing protein [Chloroflexia bacterium]
MTHYAISPIDDAISRQVRTTLTDPIYGLEVPVSVAGPGNYGPCRSCLHTFTIGERRILFLYNPFSPEQHADFAGPVFIHDGDCESYSQRAVFPPAIRSLPIVLKGYGADNRFIAEETPPGPDVETAIDTLFHRPDVAFIHVRNREAKCFILRIARAHT